MTDFFFVFLNIYFLTHCSEQTWFHLESSIPMNFGTSNYTCRTILTVREFNLIRVKYLWMHGSSLMVLENEMVFHILFKLTGLIESAFLIPMDTEQKEQPSYIQKKKKATLSWSIIHVYYLARLSGPLFITIFFKPFRQLKLMLMMIKISIFLSNSSVTILAILILGLPEITSCNQSFPV